jgi:hypothetical protein
MFLSKIWFVLIGLAAGVATTAAFVAPRSANRTIMELEGQRLDRAQYAADEMLRAEAHRWIDYAAKLARDADLITSLDSLNSSKNNEPAMVSKSVKGYLTGLVKDLGKAGIESVGAVDAKGRLVARLGERENDVGESVAGMEVINDALHGYLSDDVWGAGGKLQRVAAVPVLSKERDHVIGAVWVAAETGKGLAEKWKKNLGVEIAILLRGQVRSATVPDTLLFDLPGLVRDRAGEIAKAKRTRPIPFMVGSDRMLAVAAPFAGEASAQEGYYVLLGKMTPPADPLALLSSTTKDDLAWGNFPWLSIGFGFIVILGVGIALQRWETEAPLARLRAEVQRLARGEIHKLDDVAYAGKFGGIARDVNAAMERFTLASPPKSETAKKDLDAILGPAPAPAAAASVFDLPQSHYGALAPAPAFAQAAPSGAGSFPFAASAPAAAPAASIFAPQAPAPSAPGYLSQSTTPPPVTLAMGAGSSGPGTPASTLGATPDRRLLSPNLSGTKAPPPPPRVPPAAAPPKTLASESLTVPAIRGGALPPNLGRPAHSPSLSMPVAGLDLEAPGEATTLDGPGFGLAAPSAVAAGDQADTGPMDDGPADSGGRGSNGEMGDGEEDEDTHIRAVFSEYVAARGRCGEPVASLTLDKFRAKLEANKQQLIAKYSCRSARFSVYVKDGKAAIKATPVR